MQPATNKAVLLIVLAINSSPRFGAVAVCSFMHVATNTQLPPDWRCHSMIDPHAYEAHTDLITLLLKQTTSYCIHPTVPLQMYAMSKSVTTPAGSLD
ncbi:hypothetical protein BDP81DRAFT_421596 [Colletotrichum phormii]|uniref:Secreted protein n=1 Tax=Colletotrichum phormii TaxID=359342 RepID=A0AAI9ZZ92_9PEZI|nr:uncharacterized protein BDP81DRAFT_421596 [Colletotrichum phormii]KAK1639663.1 hypothetical protein BDP81DRAFT_421596 [Colletotrichum phormii]